jgi:hypothetical protein
MSRFWSVTVALAQLTGAGVVGGCGGDVTRPSRISLTKENGDGQAGTVGQPLPGNLLVRVTEGDILVMGATVTWSTNAEGSSLDPATSLTDMTGVASTTWTLGNFAGVQAVQASVGGASGSPAVFTAQAQPGPPALLEKDSGEGQNGPANTLLSSPFKAKVSDQFGNGVPAITVVWAGTNATVSAATVPTNVSGLSVVDVTLGGTVGSASVTATVEGLAGSPVTFTALVTEFIRRPGTLQRR